MGRVLRRYGPSTPLDKVPQIEGPNVYIWVFRNGLQSGRDYVYDNELILLSLKILKELQEGKIGSNQDEIRDWFVNKKGDNKNQKKENKKKISQEDLIDAIVSEIFYEVKSNGTKKRSRRKKQSTTDFNSDNKPFEFLFSEYDKYDAVKKLYESLPEDGSYLIKFQQTKDILDAGYMSDRKEEAQKMFREIYTLSAIPTKRGKIENGSLKDEFLKEVEAFLKQPDEKRNYTFFKRDILSQFVVQIANWHKNETEPVDEWISIQDIKGCSEEEKRKISRWCQGIYFVEHAYDVDTGILRKDLKTDALIY